MDFTLSEVLTVTQPRLFKVKLAQFSIIPNHLGSAVGMLKSFSFVLFLFFSNPLPLPPSLPTLLIFRLLLPLLLFLLLLIQLLIRLSVPLSLIHLLLEKKKLSTKSCSQVSKIHLHQINQNQGSQNFFRGNIWEQVMQRISKQLRTRIGILLSFSNFFFST